MNVISPPSILQPQETEVEPKLKATEDPELIREKILFTLKIYPYLSASMLQIGIGPSTPSKLIHHELDQLIEAGLVTQDFIVKKTPTGRTNTYTIIRLTSFPASPIK